MGKTRPILYGVADYAELRRANAWFIDHAALIEMKYVKAGDPAPTPGQLADIKAKAVEQLDQYASGPCALGGGRHATGTTGVPPVANGQDACSPSSLVSLHRLVLVFHGGDCVLAEAA